MINTVLHLNLKSTHINNNNTIKKIVSIERKTRVVVRSNFHLKIPLHVQTEFVIA